MAKNPNRDKITEAFLALLAEKPFEKIGLAAVGEKAGVSLADMRGEFGSTFDIVSAFVRETDRKVLGERASVPEGAGDAERSLALLGDLYGSSSDLALVLAQELLGERGRLNTPATVNDGNWTWRLPRPVEDLAADPAVAARMAALRARIESSGRLPGRRG